MKSGTSRAINRCYKHGIAISNSQFDKIMKLYYKNDMPISIQVMIIARDWDSEFFEFAKKELEKMDKKSN